MVCRVTVVLDIAKNQNKSRDFEIHEIPFKIEYRLFLQPNSNPLYSIKTYSILTGWGG